MKVILKLFIVGGSARGQQAEKAVRRLCDTRLDDGYELSVVDVIASPKIAERDKVIATPTLIRVAPEPTRRIVGDLMDLRQVASGLDLRVDPSEGGS